MSQGWGFIKSTVFPPILSNWAKASYTALVLKHNTRSLRMTKLSQGLQSIPQASYSSTSTYYGSFLSAGGSVSSKHGADADFSPDNLRAFVCETRRGSGIEG